MSKGCKIVLDFDRPDRALVEQFAGLPVANIDDCMGRTAAMNYRIRPMNSSPLLGTAFTEEDKPAWEPNAGIWAPDINYINGKYVLYYAMSGWGGGATCGIGVAVCDKPTGPFEDLGILFRSGDIGEAERLHIVVIHHLAEVNH